MARKGKQPTKAAVFPEGFVPPTSVMVDTPELAPVELGPEAPKTFTVRVGYKDSNDIEEVLFVSPKTNATLYITEAWRRELNQYDLWNRVYAAHIEFVKRAKAAGYERSMLFVYSKQCNDFATIEMTLGELYAVKNIFDQQQATRARNRSGRR